MMLNVVPPMPDFEAMKKSWRRASASQKFFRVSLVGGAIGGALYLLHRYQIEQQPSQGSTPQRQAPVGSGQRGTYR